MSAALDQRLFTYLHISCDEENELKQTNRQRHVRVTSTGSILQQAPGLYRLLTLIHRHCDSFKKAQIPVVKRGIEHYSQKRETVLSNKIRNGHWVRIEVLGKLMECVLQDEIPQPQLL